jgi:drug/metabolite transporter (DMT)-like permease
MTQRKTQVNFARGVVLAICAALSLSIMAIFVKLATVRTTDGVIVLFRFAISCIYIVLLLSCKKKQGDQIALLAALKTEHIFLYLARVIAAVLAMLLFYFSLRYIPVVDGTLLSMTSALFVPILMLIFLKIKIGLKEWFGIILGFVGVVLVLKPGHELFTPMSLVALGAGFCVALSLLFLRELSKYDNPDTIMLYYFPLAFLLSALVAIFDWQTPNWQVIKLLIGVGIFGTAYQEFLIRAAQHASAKVIATLLYLAVVFSGLLGWIIFGELPHILTWIGIILVCCGAIVTIIFAPQEVS